MLAEPEAHHRAVEAGLRMVPEGLSHMGMNTGFAEATHGPAVDTDPEEHYWAVVVVVDRKVVEKATRTTDVAWADSVGSVGYTGQEGGKPEGAHIPGLAKNRMAAAVGEVPVEDTGLEVVGYTGQLILIVNLADHQGSRTIRSYEEALHMEDIRSLEEVDKP